jgi:hypothetical protein
MARPAERIGAEGFMTGETRNDNPSAAACEMPNAIVKLLVGGNAQRKSR